MVQGVSNNGFIHPAFLTNAGQAQAFGAPGPLPPVIIQRPQGDFYQFNNMGFPQQQPKRSLGVLEGVGAFLKGATVDTLKSLLSPSGILMAAAGVALAVAFPVTIPFMIAAGVATSGLSLATNGYQAYALNQEGDVEGAKAALRGAGSSTTGLALSMFGARQHVRSAGSAKYGAGAEDAGVFGATGRMFRAGFQSAKGRVTDFIAARKGGFTPVTPTPVPPTAAPAGPSLGLPAPSSPTSANSAGSSGALGTPVPPQAGAQSAAGAQTQGAQAGAQQAGPAPTFRQRFENSEAYKNLRRAYDDSAFQRATDPNGQTVYQQIPMPNNPTRMQRAEYWGQRIYNMGQQAHDLHPGLIPYTVGSNAVNSDAMMEHYRRNYQ